MLKCRKLSKSWDSIAISTFYARRKTQDELYDLTVLRDIELSQRTKNATPAIKKEAQYVLRAVFEQINLFQFSYKDIDYSQLIAQLNTLIARYNGLINTRASRTASRKKKAAAKLEQQNEVMSTEKHEIIAQERKSKNKQCGNNESKLLSRSIFPEEGEIKINIPPLNIFKNLKLPDDKESS